LTEIPDEIIEKKWKKKILSWLENTTSTPSGFHLGHYKAHFKPHQWFFEESGSQKEQMDKKQQQIAQSHLIFINTLFTNSISLNRWKTAHSIMLFKDKTNQFLHRARNVHINEAD
jgi:hypothetical protein